TVSVDVKPTHYSLSAVSESFLLEIVDADALSTIGTRTRGDSMYGHHVEGPPGKGDGPRPLQHCCPIMLVNLAISLFRKV
ncbi:hypothetical protein ALC57_15657, partial [Trachymyrmex cornetzi]